MGLYISVDEIFDNDHRIVSQRGNAQGRFTFSAADSGDHRICFTPTNVPSAQGWLSGGSSAGNIKLEVDMAIGETSRIESDDKHKIGDIVSKVRDLNARLSDIRKEQVFQRVSFAVMLSICVEICTDSREPGTRGRVQKHVRIYQRPCRALDSYPTCHPRCHLRLAALSSQSLLHQAKAHLDDLSRKNQISQNFIFYLQMFSRHANHDENENNDLMYCLSVELRADSD